jgi:hypothetical protein
VMSLFSENYSPDFAEIESLQLAVRQATLLDSGPPRGSERLRTVLHQAFRDLADGPEDRPTGRDVAALRDVLRLGWCHDVLAP